MTDAALLLARIAGGDRNALQALYQAQSVRLFGVAMAILRDREAASDALHDGFVNIARRAGMFDPALGRAEAWLATVIRYAALDIARRRGREIPTDDATLGETPADATQLDTLAADEDGARLRACLEGLPEKNRQGILLAFVNGLSHPQIAARLELPIGTVKSWIRRGLLSLRECLT
ncbi:sigma-70 family RNA polymerase sigma factor [Rhodovarius crocodyli]|uniref:Sigma-70 family RNA polymerase sigma factor n=1 Tax=Rhodovarius crocodyli TaxID=1979269 RepID=A0A437M2I4_9PROT|nr:sigma-70 family RNA polymerase sigma factor [Rhodovarius crocodyli]RVT91897.1 sigma-70 family RNA polymerase sigma factor [Rhodovarius crocodyli]